MRVKTGTMDPQIKSVTIMALLMLFSLSSIHVQDQNPELGRYIDQYEGRAGARKLEVKVLRVGKKENEEVLIKVTGVDDPLDGQIFKYKKEWQSSDKHQNKYIYVTDQVPGKDRIATFHSDYSYGGQVLKVFLLDALYDPIYIYPKDYQENLDPNFMYAQYLEQQKERDQNIE